MLLKGTAQTWTVVEKELVELVEGPSLEFGLESACLT